MRLLRILPLVVLAAAALALTGCDPQPEPETTATAPSTTKGTPSFAPTPEAVKNVKESQAASKSR